MRDAIQFAVLGLGIAAIYTLLGQGLVLLYSGSGVLNLAQGGTAMFTAYLFRQLRDLDGWPLWPALAVSVLAAAGFGVAVHVLVMRPLRHASSLARVVATLGLLAMLQGGASLIWGNRPTIIQPLLPEEVFVVDGVVIPEDRLWLLAIAAAVTAALWFAYRFTAVGLAARAGAQNPRAAASLAWSPDVMAAGTWAISSALAGIAGILIVPITSLTPETLPLLVIPVTAAALVGGFTSFPLTLVGALVIGVATSELALYYPQHPGLQWTVPFGLIVLLLVVRGRGLPTRGFFVERLPEVSTGRIPWRFVAPLLAVLTYLIVAEFPKDFLDSLIVSLGWATIMLSVVVLLGFTSQLSFEQMAMAGLTALIAARLILDWGLPLELAWIAAVLASVPIGVLFALPALRTRGINLAVVTLGLSVLIFEAVQSNDRYTGGDDGLPVEGRRILGIDVDPLHHGNRYALLALIVFVLCAVAVANVRRGQSGNALIAVRTNERAAAALGINVLAAKTFAFILGATVAGLGGIILAFRLPVVQLLHTFSPLQSVLVVSFAVIGGVGFLSGPVLGSCLVAGGLGGWILNSLFPSANLFWLTLIGGLNVLLIVILHPDGIAAVQAAQGRWIARKVRQRLGWSPPAAKPLPTSVRQPIRPLSLEVRGLTVTFGGVVAVDNVDFDVHPGEVVGLIGPNGAGKTTVIDAVTGFTRPAAGSVIVDGEPIDRLPVHKRAHIGLSRSFQALELFEQSSVRQNLQVASDSRSLLAYAGDVVHPRRAPLSAASVAAVREFDLEPELDADVRDLSYGRRRLVAIARTIASNPSLILLDEPAAGLSGHESRELATVVRRLAVEWGMGVLLVEHDMTFVMDVCDRIVVLDFGRKIAEGTPAEVRRHPEVVAAYLGEAPSESHETP